MANVKTAISLRQSLFDRVEALARELHISRSRVFALAAEAYVQRYENQRLLEAINAAFDELPDSEDETLRQGMRRQHKQLVEGQW